MDHSNIIKDCLNGDRKAQRALIDAYSSLLMSICQRYVSQRESAEDALQESWIRIFKGMDGYKEEGHFKAWICKITIHTALRWNERIKPTETLESATVNAMPDFEPGALQKLKAADLLALLDMLPERCSTVFKLAIVDGYSHREIGEMLGINESTSRVYLTRAREQLRILIVDHEKVANQ